MPRVTPPAIDGWRQRLRWFQYQPAHGGHANDFPMLWCALPAFDLATARTLCEALGAPMRAIGPDEPRPTPGVPLTSEAWAQLAHPLSAYPDYEAPRTPRVFGERCEVIITSTEIMLVLPPAGAWDVTAAHVEAAARIEAALDAAGLAPGPPR